MSLQSVNLWTKKLKEEMLEYLKRRNLKDVIYWKPKFQRILSKGHWHDNGEIPVEEKQI